jgi:tight adherence protein C
MNDQTLLMICLTGAVALVGFFLTRLMMGHSDDKLRKRLTATAYDDAKPVARKTVRQVVEQVGAAAAKPFMPSTREKQSGLRAQFARAGMYNPSAVKLVTGFKVIFLCAGLAIGYGLGSYFGSPLLGFSAGGIVGYLAPQFWLKSKIKKNQQALTYGLADALDLMVVCVEAGLTVDGAMQRVAQDLSIAHPSISRELGIAHWETRVGLSRVEALRNLGIRTGNEPLQSLAAMLIQADRFGTSIAAALRVHSDTLRQNRQRAAEENAAKASVKMSFPLVLFIFPATFIVLIGPTIINLMNSELMK